MSSQFSDLFDSVDDTLFSVFGESLEATYTRPGEAGVAVEVVIDREQSLVTAGTGAVSERQAMMHLRLAQLPDTPARNDEIDIGGTLYVVDSPADIDPDGIMITVEVRRQ